MLDNKEYNEDMIYMKQFEIVDLDIIITKGNMLKNMKNEIDKLEKIPEENLKEYYEKFT